MALEGQFVFETITTSGVRECHGPRLWVLRDGGRDGIVFVGGWRKFCERGRVSCLLMYLML